MASGDPAGHTAGDSQAATQVVLDTVQARRAQDPLIGAKVGAKEALHRIIHAMQGERGVHIDSLLCALGALAGYACQASARARAQAEGNTDADIFTLVRGVDGKQYFYGDAINWPLVEAPLSVWSLAAGVVQQLGGSTFADPLEIFRYVAGSVGGEGFGIPRWPAGHGSAQPPRDYVAIFWPMLLPVLEMLCTQPSEWPVLYGLAIQEAIVLGKDALAPELALNIVMESAVPMSKIDLTSIDSVSALSNAR